MNTVHVYKIIFDESDYTYNHIKNIIINIFKL